VSPERRMRVLGKRFLPSGDRVWTDLRYRYVLSNRFVLKLVEQPPADMAALLHAFPSTPPVVRRRSKELLDVIRDAVKRGLSIAVEGPGPLVAESSGPNVSSNEMDSDNLLAPNPPVPQSSSLWSSDEPLPTATSSSLFGASIPSSRPRPVYSTTSSSLFGSLPPSGVPKDNSLSRFQNVVKKIHSTLVIAPTVPAV